MPQWRGEFHRNCPLPPSSYLVVTKQATAPTAAAGGADVRSGQMQTAQEFSAACIWSLRTSGAARDAGRGRLGPMASPESCGFVALRDCSVESGSLCGVSFSRT